MSSGGYALPRAIVGERALSEVTQSRFRYIYLFIYMVRRTSFSALNVKCAELSVGHFLNSSHWKRTLKLIFKGSGCFQFPEAVVTSTKKAYALPNVLHYKLSLFYRSRNCRVQL